MTQSGRASFEAAAGPAPAVFYCAVCRARLIISSAPDSSKPGPNLFDGSRIDESFIVLDYKRTQQGVPAGSGPGPPKGLEESFVLLPTGPQRTNIPTLPGTGVPPAPGRPPVAPSSPPQVQAADSGPQPVGLDAKLQALSQLFDLASTTMQVDHPLCLDCASQLKDEIEAQIQEAEQEIASYAAAAAALEASQQASLPEAEFEQEMWRLRAAQDEQRQLAEQAGKDLEEARRDLQSLQAVSKDLDELEDKYWQSYNEFQSLLKAHVEERDGLLARINYVNQRKQLLQATNVYNDAFKIWHDGPFATISGFRLGRTPEVPVEWDEINAAWGQAVLLLHTMAQNCGLSFQSARLIPMGSHPRVADKRATYDLFGPVSKLWSSNYDRAMICYLACLKEFGDYAEEQDKRLGGERTFYGFPFAIEGDKVNGHTIKLTLNKDAKWTKALKFMLANLKKALQWMVKYEAVRREQEAQNKMSALRAEPAQHH